MSGFNDIQLTDLAEKLNRRHVLTREQDGRRFDYVEGWFVIAEANAIFGFDGWDRETFEIERAFERVTRDATVCGYRARVRVRVRAGDDLVVREGCGFASAQGCDPCEVHERAVKSAETDATKRALATFGNRFGLALYDPDQAGVTGSSKSKDPKLTLRDSSGAVLGRNLDGSAFCRQLRPLIEACASAETVKTLRAKNAKALERLRQCAELKTPKGMHYADILIRLIEDRLARPATRLSDRDINTDSPFGTAAASARDEMALDPAANLKAQNGPQEADGGDFGVGPWDRASEEIAAPATEIAAPVLPPSRPSRLSPSQAVDKNTLAFSTERRVRDKAHLLFVASLPCLVCEELQCHAHHITFAQRRGMSVKVSDEYTVPLCPAHHNGLHQSNAEQAWWRKEGIDPLAKAAQLWEETIAQRQAIAAQ